MISSCTVIGISRFTTFVRDIVPLRPFPATSSFVEEKVLVGIYLHFSW